MAQVFLRSFRITAPAPYEQAVKELLEAEGYRFEPEPFSPLCWRLVQEPRPLGSSLAAFFGYIYIQDRSSMLPPLALAPEAGATVLDMCASPGSKTGFLCQLVGPEGFVLANELSHSRLFTLRANLRVCNFIQAGTCSYEGQALPLFPETFDSIQLDPPCSGWGTVEKNPKVLALWKGDKVKPLIGLQRLLLQKAASLLRVGGHLVYSTCTTNSEENECQVRYAEEELGLVREPLRPFEGFVWDEKEGSEGTLRVDGKKSLAQGFFVARLRKKEAIRTSSATSFETCFREKPRKKQNMAQDLPAQLLRSATLDPARAASGARFASFAGTVRYLPAATSSLLPDSFVWQGAAIGRLSAGGVQADTRLRVLMPETGKRLILETIDEIRCLLDGRSMQTDLENGDAALFWRTLPLGRISVKNRRIIASFQR